MDTPKAIIINGHPLSSMKLLRGLTLALLLAGIGIAFGGCAAHTQFARFDGVRPSLPRAALKGKSAYDQDRTGFGIARPLARPGSFERKPVVKAKAVVPPSLVATSDSVAAPSAWVEKLHEDIHQSKLRLEKLAEEIKSYRKSRQEDQQVTGSVTTAVVATDGLTPALRSAQGACE